MKIIEVKVCQFLPAGEILEVEKWPVTFLRGKNNSARVHGICRNFIWTRLKRFR